MNLFILSSCASSAPKTGETEVSQSKEEIKTEIAKNEEDDYVYDDLLASLPDFDFNGVSFRIATDDVSLFAPQNSESFVGREIYLRNRAVEEKYHVKLVLTQESGTVGIADRIKTEAMAGTSFCDLVVLKSPQFQTLVSSKLLHNVRTVPYLQLNQEGMHPDSVSATTLGAFSYGFSGDFIYKAENTFAVFFNKSLLESTQLPDIYSLVRDNQWDYDNFLLYAEEVYSLSRSLGLKKAGFLSTESREGLINALWAASGQSFLNNDYGERPYLQYQNEVTDDFVKKLQKLLFRSVAYSENSASAIHEFAAGNSLFLIAPLSSVDEIKSQGVKFGIVPLPKQDINQSKFYSYMTAEYSLAGMVLGSPDLTLSGLVSTGLAKASVGLNQKLAVISYLNLHLHSEEDGEMLQRIMASPYYDPVEFFGQIDPSFPASTQTLLYRVISSDGRFDALYSQYSKMLEKYLDENL